MCSPIDHERSFHTPSLEGPEEDVVARWHVPLGESFSKRNRYAGTGKEITVREDAPEGLRFAVLELARELDWGPSSLRDIVCRVLRARPDSSNWSEYPNVWGEVQDLVYGADWFKVYDIIEAIHAAMLRHDREHHSNDAQKFTVGVNSYFVEEGIGWQLSDGQVVTRGTEAFESVVAGAEKALKKSGRPTAAGHIHEALQDLSRRPKPDLPGAIYHGMGALEAVARDLTGDAKATLGEVLKRNPKLLPKPLDTALSQVWGYASNEARHVEEGREPAREEAELVVGLAAVVATYLTKK